MKLLSNIPIEDLTPENDYLGIIEKGDMIASLLKSGNINFKEIKMFALYGNWGSGKSTLMKYLQKELNDEFNTFYFDAWKYENGSDLSYSLLEFLVDTGLDSVTKIGRKLLTTGKKVLIGAVKGIDPITKGVIEELEDNNLESFHFQIEKFKTEFKKFEGELFQKDSGKKKTNIVFVDDLDRCEPEKVLDLLSEIKLFFSYGERTIFFFGVDQKAVGVAIKTRYGDVVKSNEYLEKIIDLDFKLSKSVNAKMMISNFFKNQLLIDNKFVDDYLQPLFAQLNFTNPRKLKKVFNKYLMTLEYKRLFPNESIIPNLLNASEGSGLQTILSIFYIILKDFDEHSIDNMIDFKRKKINYLRAHKFYMEQFKRSGNPNYFEALFTNIKFYQSVSKTFLECHSNARAANFAPFLVLFAPYDPQSISLPALDQHEFFEGFTPKQDDLLFKMTYYLVAIFLPKYQLSDHDRSEYKFIDLKMFIEKYI